MKRLEDDALKERVYHIKCMQNIDGYMNSPSNAQDKFVLVSRTDLEKMLHTLGFALSDFIQLPSAYDTTTLIPKRDCVIGEESLSLHLYEKDQKVIAQTLKNGQILLLLSHNSQSTVDGLMRALNAQEYKPIIFYVASSRRSSNQLKYAFGGHTWTWDTEVHEEGGEVVLRDDFGHPLVYKEKEGVYTLTSISSDELSASLLAAILKALNTGSYVKDHIKYIARVLQERHEDQTKARLTESKEQIGQIEERIKVLTEELQAAKKHLMALQEEKDALLQRQKQYTSEELIALFAEQIGKLEKEVGQVSLFFWQGLGYHEYFEVRTPEGSVKLLEHEVLQDPETLVARVLEKMRNLSH